MKVCVNNILMFHLNSKSGNPIEKVRKDRILLLVMREYLKRFKNTDIVPAYIISMLFSPFISDHVLKSFEETVLLEASSLNGQILDPGSTDIIELFKHLYDESIDPFAIYPNSKYGVYERNNDSQSNLTESVIENMNNSIFSERSKTDSTINESIWVDISIKDGNVGTSNVIFEEPFEIQKKKSETEKQEKTGLCRFLSSSWGHFQFFLYEERRIS